MHIVIMESRLHFLVFLLGALLVSGSSVFGYNNNKIIGADYGISTFNRSSFSGDFIFGAASSSYQYEGAADEDGRGPSIWDTFSHKYPGKIKDGSNGDVAVDSYHRYKEDVNIIKNMGLDAYRFSISWSRILPYGKLHRGVNKKGIAYYHSLIDQLLANGIKPFVTLFHWDLPQALEDEYGGFLSPHIVDDFRDYADVCFSEFGNKVKHWITLNEPWTYSSFGYATGTLAPGRCSDWQNLNCTGGDSATEPYLVGHHQLLAHAAAVNLYKHKYQVSQKGIIGITLVSHWFVPRSQAMHDRNAALRAVDFMLGWFLDPIMTGDYPHTMRSLVRERLPLFTKEQSRMVKGSFDFVGMNYYTGFYASYDPSLKSIKPSYNTDSLVKQAEERNGIPIGLKTASFYVYPRGFYDLLVYIKNKYNNNPFIYITESGTGEANNEEQSLTEALNDPVRVRFYHDHLAYLHRAIKEGVNVKGYFPWSLLDNFEWNSGYAIRFGLNYVDYKDGLKRYPKLSAHWFKKFLA